VCVCTDSPNGDKKIIDCANSVLKEHSYWPLVSDLINLFSHQDVALYFMSDTTLLTHWASIMACFQGLVLYKSFQSYIVCLLLRLELWICDILTFYPVGVFRVKLLCLH